jgi:hypothetical protein
VGTERVDPDGVRSRLYARVCDGRLTGWRWFRVPDPAAPLAAATAQVRRRLPAPRGRFSPDVTAGNAVVHLPVWFAAPGEWAPVAATAAAGGAAVTVTAAPVRLEFDPGDGSPPVSCAGPGPVFTPDAAEPDRPPACSHTYADASSAAPDGRAWPARLTIGWRVTWTASDGQAGALDPLTTATAVPAVVGEIQAVEKAR